MPIQFKTQDPSTVQNAKDSNHLNVFIDSNDGLMKNKDSSGTITAIGGGSPGGSDGYLQYNNSGSFAASGIRHSDSTGLYGDYGFSQGYTFNCGQAVIFQNASEVKLVDGDGAGTELMKNDGGSIVWKTTDATSAPTLSINPGNSSSNGADLWVQAGSSSSNNGGSLHLKSGSGDIENGDVITEARNVQTYASSILSFNAGGSIYFNTVDCSALGGGGTPGQVLSLASDDPALLWVDASGGQTPWTSDVDSAGYNLNNAVNILGQTRSTLRLASNNVSGVAAFIDMYSDITGIRMDTSGATGDISLNAGGEINLTASSSIVYNNDINLNSNQLNNVAAVRAPSGANLYLGDDTLSEKIVIYPADRIEINSNNAGDIYFIPGTDKDIYFRQSNSDAQQKFNIPTGGDNGKVLTYDSSGNQMIWADGGGGNPLSSNLDCAVNGIVNTSYLQLYHNSTNEIQISAGHDFNDLPALQIQDLVNSKVINLCFERYDGTAAQEGDVLTWKSSLSEAHFEAPSGGGSGVANPMTEDLDVSTYTIKSTSGNDLHLQASDDLYCNFSGSLYFNGIDGSALIGSSGDNGKSLGFDHANQKLIWKDPGSAIADASTGSLTLLTDVITATNELRTKLNAALAVLRDYKIIAT